MTPDFKVHGFNLKITFFLPYQSKSRSYISPRKSAEVSYPYECKPRGPLRLAARVHSSPGSWTGMYMSPIFSCGDANTYIYGWKMFAYDGF